jgi:phage shock protein PspC (stress-responsive transcriptional regulator)
MKKTVNVNVGGYSFILEEIAYEQLNMYLNNVRRNLGNDVDANEVMNDIESRIAELFREALRESGREVVDSALIDRVIGIMGKPEDYGDGTEHQQQQYQQSNYQETVPRALFRDPENKMLGGVAAGLANYCGWDPLAIRIIFVLLLFGFGVGLPVYILLWILVPEAKTTADKLKMRGQPVNVDTIKKRFNDFKTDVNQLGSKENQKKIKDTAYSIGSRIEGVFRDFGKGISRLAGIFLLFIGVVISVFLLKYLITGSLSFPVSAGEELFINHKDLFFDNSYDFYCVVIGLTALAFLILLGVISKGLELLFKIRIRSNPVRYASITFSIIAVIVVFYGGVNFIKQYNHRKTIHSRYEVPLKDSTVSLTVLKDEYFNNKVSSVHTGEDELIKVTSSRIIFGYPSLAVKLSENGRSYIEVEKTASGARDLKAIANCEAIDYTVQADTGKVVLPPVFSTSYKNKFRNQKVDITLYIPKNTVLRNEGNFRRVFNPYESFISSDELPDAPEYIMTDNGLAEHKSRH